MTLKPAEMSTQNSSLSRELSDRAIDGPKAKGLRRLLRVFYLILQPTNYMDDNVQRYGPTFQIGADSESPLVYVGDPEMVREIFTLDASTAETGSRNQVLQPMVGDRSILLLDGDPHRRQRKLLMPPFHGDRLRSYGELICGITRQVSADWQVGQSIVARPPIQTLTLGVILQAVFGLREGPRLSKLQQQMSTLLDFFSYPISASFLFFPALQKDWGLWSPWTKFTHLREEVRSLIYAEIRERRQFLQNSERTQIERTDILTLLLQSRDENGEAMSDEELHDELVTLLLAGHETTASAIVWA
ncbi:MAG: cytochrome P450, partial [Phormidesmis sp.]